jgi:hypothetical protein
MQRFLFTILLLSVFSYWGHTQTNKNDSLQIANYLHQQVIYKQARVSCQMLDSISSAKLYVSKMNFQMGDGSSIPTTFDFIKTAAGFKPLFSSQEMITCPEFLASINKNFKLKDEKSAFKFQEILDVVDSRNNLNSDRAFFHKENSWYFIRDKFFDDIEAFIIETNDNGKITSISFKKSKKDFEIPENVVESSSHSAKWGYKSPTVSLKDSAYLRSYLNEQTNFHFEFNKIESRLVKKISTADFYHAEIVYTADNCSSAMGFKLMKTSDTIMHANGNRKLLEKPEFMKSLRPNLIIKSREDAMTFEEALDVLVPIGTFDTEDKALLQLDGKWYFVRSESFGDKAAFVIETDAKGHIKSFNHTSKAMKIN